MTLEQFSQVYSTGSSYSTDRKSLDFRSFLAFCIVVSFSLVCSVSTSDSESSLSSVTSLKVSRSQNMKQKIYEILTSPKIQTNGVILNNCIDQVCLCFDRLLLLDLSAVQVLHTSYVATFQDRKTNSFVHFWVKFRHYNFVFEIY